MYLCQINGSLLFDKFWDIKFQASHRLESVFCIQILNYLRVLDWFCLRATQITSGCTAECAAQVLNTQIHIQWGESSPAKHGGAYFSAVVCPKILAITEKAIEKPHALHNSLRIHLARTFGATGKEQPSPPLHPAAAAGLLRCFDEYKSLYTRNLLAIIKKKLGNNYHRLKHF